MLLSILALHKYSRKHEHIKSTSHALIWSVHWFQALQWAHDSAESLSNTVVLPSGWSSSIRERKFISLSTHRETGTHTYYSAIFHKEWSNYAEEWCSEYNESRNGASSVCLCFCLCVHVYVYAEPWSIDYRFSKGIFVEMTELLAHLHYWVQSSRCIRDGDSHIVASRTIYQSKFFLTKLHVCTQWPNM